MIAEGGPADPLWHLLREQVHVGWVTSGKLLARKRPRLVPVYDEFVKCAMGKPGNFWTALRGALRHDDCRLLRDIGTLKETSAIPPAVTELRTLDVAVWMHHRRNHTKRGCTGL